ncbi:MAG: glycosyltransferase family 2 protein [Lentisphaeria bacterium]|jgi:glycosyltransferase involved in cell wall biosynthesis
MGEPRPKISVILPCRNEVQHIEECVRSLLAQEPPAGGMEFIIADGMSNDGTREILRRMAAESPALQVIDNPGKITPSGLNAAIRAAKGEIIVRMDAHTEYAPDYVVRCVETLEKTGADNVGGPALTNPQTYMQRVIAAAYHCPWVVGGSRFHDAGYEGVVDTVTYGCWRRSGFDRFGYFDEELVRNQDDEHNLRITRGGGKVWQSPAIQSWYAPRSSLGSLFRQYFQYGYWKVRVIQKHKIPASPRHLIPGAFVLALALLAPAALFWVPARLLLGAQLSAYAAFLLLVSADIARRNGWRLFPPLPAVVAAYQLSYGLGFLLGIFDFVIFRSRGRYRTLSR